MVTCMHVTISASAIIFLRPSLVFHYARNHNILIQQYTPSQLHHCLTITLTLGVPNQRALTPDNMKAGTGLSVGFYKADGSEVEHLQYTCATHTSSRGDPMQVFHAEICQEPGTFFSIVINLDGEQYIIYSANGLKVTTAIGHTQQEPGALEDVQAFFAPLKKRRSDELKIRHMVHWVLEKSKDEDSPRKVKEHHLL